MKMRLEATYCTLGDVLHRARERSGASVVFRVAAVPVLAGLLLFGVMAAKAALGLRNADQSPPCSFEKNSDLRRSGVLASGHGAIPSPAARPDGWRFPNSSVHALLPLPKGEPTEGGVAHPSGDVDYPANVGNRWPVMADASRRLTVERVPGSVSTRSSWTGTTKWYHGSGDLWVSTWVKNDDGKPFLLLAAGDGFGLSYRPAAGPADIIAYQRKENGEIVAYPYFGVSGAWRVLPSLFICTFHGSPEEDKGAGSDRPVGPSGEPLPAPGETIARFLWSYDPVASTGEFVGGYDPGTSYTIPNMPYWPITSISYYDPANGIDSHSYRIRRELKPTGLIHFDTGSGDGATYLACHEHNPNFPENFGNEDFRTWEPTGAAQRVYIFKSTDQGLHWGPWLNDGEDNLPRLDLSTSRVWTDFRFTTPVFCQFGMAYGDYGDAFPGETVKYLYAFSTHERWWNQDNLYLGRVKVYDNETGGWQTDRMLDAGNWQYWVGTAREGQPIWDNSVSNAAPILHARGEIAQPSVLYHKDSGLYLMTTFSTSGRNSLDGWPDRRTCPDSLTSTSVPVGGKVDTHWILWQAPELWGPWEKVITNDYNGSGEYNEADKKAFMEYNLQIMPTWISSLGPGEWSIWLLHSGFVNFFRNADKLRFEGGAVHLDYPFYGAPDWLEGGHTLQLSQLAFSQAAKPISASLSPLYQHEQNNRPAFSSVEITVGYHFRLREDRTITHLGRYHVTGNTGTHTLQVVPVRITGLTAARAGDSVAAVSLDLSSFTPGQMDELGFVYAELPSPAVLSANADYLLLSSEGGACADAFFGGPSQNAELDRNSGPNWRLNCVMDLPEVSTGWVLSILHAATHNRANAWALMNSVSYPSEVCGVPISGVYGNVYGAVNLLFQQESGKAPHAMHSAVAATPVSPPNERLVGTRFTVASDVIASALGRMKVSGNSAVHEVRLMLDNGGGGYTTIASVPIRMYPATLDNTSVYGDLPTPVRLEKGKTYVLVSREFSGVSENYCGQSAMTSLDGNVFSGSTACWFQWTNNSVGQKTDGDGGKCYGGVNLKFY